jgi:phosphoribosyl-ATP pyrophosphohydrolase/phosphoribosyl-AMP cyclohydrolase
MTIDFNKGNGLVPVIIQDFKTAQVLMLGYMNEEAYNKTKKDNKVCFYSRSKQRLWTKGETSGNYLIPKKVFFDCDQDALLIKAEAKGPTCHLGQTSCFKDKNTANFLAELEMIINERAITDTDKSYTRSLLSEGLNKVTQKFGEEAIELVIEAKDNDRIKFMDEAADMLYHFLVLLNIKNISIMEVNDVLESRHLGN